ncbi:MAG: hypothetical protein MJZ72_05420 [Bacteroidales bacterium]|nr:hypothetical protein [Bacteroidales bacterium]
MNFNKEEDANKRSPLFSLFMKATIYIFGNFASGYSQYPDNYTRDMFTLVSKSRKSASELVYRREGALTYYIYTREISRSAGTFIGLCYVFNGILITDFTYLFDVFEDAITNIVVKGELLEFTNDGYLTTKVNQLYTNTEELQRVSDYLNIKLSSLGKYAEKLPPANFSISNAEWKVFTFDEITEAKDAIKNYSNIRVLKGENYDADALQGYAHKLRLQNAEIKALNKTISKQRDEITSLERQKKQIKWVVFLLVLIIVGGVVFYFYAQDKIQIIQNKSEEIKHLNEEVQNKNMHIESLTSDSINLVRQNNLIKQKLRDVHDELENTIPLYTYFDTWTSTNHKQPNSTSQVTYSLYAYAGDELHLSYFVSSESGYDFLKISLKRDGFSAQQLIKESGVRSGTYNHTFSANDTYQLTVSYSKDGSNDSNNDKAGVKELYIYRPIVKKLRQMSEYQQ